MNKEIHRRYSKTEVQKSQQEGETISSFELLKQLERQKDISIGIPWAFANNLWVSNTKSGKFFNILTIAGILLVIYSVIKLRFDLVMLTALLTGFHSWIVTKIASGWLREEVLSHKVKFQTLYDSSIVRIKIKDIENIMLMHPVDWSKELKNWYLKRFR